MVKVKQIFKYIINNKRIMYLLSISVLLLFCLILNITFSLFTASTNKEGAHIKIGEMSYIFDINAEYEELNSDIYNDRVIRIDANAIKIYHVDITAENKYNTKYQLIYNYCSSFSASTNKCTYGNNIDGVKVYYAEDTTDNVNDIIASNGSKRIKVVVENTTENIHYYELGMLAGYTHNDLNINTNKGIAITDSFEISEANDALNIITYVDGIELVSGAVYPTTPNYLVDFSCFDANNEKINSPGKIIWNGTEWIVTMNYIPLTAKCTATFTESNYVYGVKRDIAVSSSAWTRIESSVGLVANAQFGTTPVQNDFDNIYPWSDIISYNYNYDLENDKVTEIMYGEDGFAFDGSNGEVLTRIPEFYYNRYQQTESDGNTYEYVLISPTYKEGYYKSEAFSVGRYTISGAANDVHSRSGVQPLTNVTITDFRRYIQETTTLGNDFGQMDYHYFGLQLLYLVEYADYNSQAKLGLGHTNENNTAAKTSGGCNTLGMKSGTLDENNAGTSSMIYRGIEDIYGNIWQYVDGINIKEYVTYICTDQTQYVVDTFAGCYKPVGYTNLNENVVYVSKLGFDANNPLVAMPIVSGGSESTHITDHYYSNNGNRIVQVGGAWSSTSRTGLWFWHLRQASSYTDAGLGARLLRTS